MASILDIAHRWANKDFGYGELRASNTRCNDTSFYSYDTVIAQWLDKDKNVMAIIDQPLSNTTVRHISKLKSAVRRDTNVFYFSLCGYPYPNVRLITNTFDVTHRMRLVDIFIHKQYQQYSRIPQSNSIADEEFSDHWWNEIWRLNKLYNNDASPQKWLKTTISKSLSKYERQEILRQRKMVRLLLAKKNHHEIVDACFGAGTWNAYLERTVPQRKAKKSREWAAKVSRYIGASSNYTYCQLKAMSPLGIFNEKCRIYNQLQSKSLQEQQHRKNAIYRAMKFVGFEKIHQSDKQTVTVKNKETGETIYKYTTRVWQSVSGDTDLYFDISTYKSFCKSSNKKQWRHRFYQIAALKQRRIDGCELYESRRNPDSFTEKERTLYNEHCTRLQKAEENQQTALRKQIARKDAMLKQKEEYRSCGMDGVRNLWRHHLENSTPVEAMPGSEYFYGGNVLLRFRKNDPTTIETSKYISISTAECRKWFPKIKSWHIDPTLFSPCQIETKIHSFRIDRFENDILIAGCHAIAYTEMERMYNEIISQI